MYTPLQPSTLIAGQYRIIQAIGRGGSGSIYLAEDTRTFNRRCVIKRLITMGNPASKARFKDEVQMITRLRHPNVAQVYAFFEEGPNAYIVMEYIAGRDLDWSLSETRNDGSILPGKAYPVEQVIRDGIVICDILEHLHSRNPPVIHCDIKPANLIRDRESEAIFLVDFGAAASNNQGENYGTPGYAAPEMYRGMRSTASDIYALGATLYHLATDDDPTTQPFQFPKLTQLPAAFRELIERCLTEQPHQRPTAQQVRSSLEQILMAPTPTQYGLIDPTGTEILSSQQLAQALKQHWNWGLNSLNDRSLQRWLRDNGLFDDMKWLNHELATNKPEQALYSLIKRFSPQKTKTPVEVRIDRQVIEIKPGEFTQLKVRAVGGPATVSIKNAPGWMQWSPTAMTLAPNQAEHFNIGIAAGYQQAASYNGSFSIVADVGQKKALQTKVAIRSIDQITPLQPHQIQKNIDTSATSLAVTTIAGVVMIVLFILTIVLGPMMPLANFLASICIGGMLGIHKDQWIDRTLVFGMALLGGIAGGYIVPLFIAGATTNAVLTFILATAGAILSGLFIDNTIV